MALEVVRCRRVHRVVFTLAGLYNISWGLIAAVGLTGKVLGPIGMSWLIWNGEWRVSALVLCVTNDFIWWVPFVVAEPISGGHVPALTPPYRSFGQSGNKSRDYGGHLMRQIFATVALATALVGAAAQTEAAKDDQDDKQRLNCRRVLRTRSRAPVRPAVMRACTRAAGCETHPPADRARPHDPIAAPRRGCKSARLPAGRA
jgi:hypothetical protein